MQTQSNKLDFTGQNIYLGFDVHLKSWKVTVMTENIAHKTFSQPPKPEVLHQYLKKNFPGGNYYSAYEAGFCGYWIHNKLKSLGVNSIVVNPADIPTTDKEKAQKEDKRDSRKIARSLRNGDLTPIYVPSVKSLEDRSLVRMRKTLVKDLAKNKNRVKSFLYYHGIDYPENFKKCDTLWTKRYINWLENLEMGDESGKLALQALVTSSKNLKSAVLDITRKIRTLSKTTVYSQRVDLLRTVSGIGLITAMIILTELENIERFNTTDKMCSFIGFVPSTHSSGEKEKVGDITNRGHSILRGALIESAWVAARIDPALSKKFNQCCKSMDSNKAIIRIAKKLVSRIRYVLKNDTPYMVGVC